jgi:hypothetical protein
MIIWIASYPRSGNTLLRILLNLAFGIKTFSLYDDSLDIGAQSELARTVGHRTHGKDREAFVTYASDSSEIFYVKTHELPQDDAKALYVVRDGRASIVSNYHYRRDVLNEDISLAQVITSKVWGRVWSNHVGAWALSNRPNTLLLRFEELIKETTSPLQQISEFLNLSPSPDVSVDFSSLHNAFPKFFRRGSNSVNIAELNGNDLRLFWRLHGKAMFQLGYADNIVGFRRNEPCPCGSGERYKHCHGKF